MIVGGTKFRVPTLERGNEDNIDYLTNLCRVDRSGVIDNRRFTPTAIHRRPFQARNHI